MSRARLAWLAPLALCLLHAALLGSWIVDDAGISFAYARNLAHGYGLVSQPAAPPVEGFSDLLWILGLTPSFWMGVFHPVWTPKLLSAAGVATAYALLARLMLREPRVGPGTVATVLTVLSLTTPFVVWCFSGLENALLVLLVAAALERSDRLLAADPPPAIGFAVGALLAAVALTRPDGVLYVSTLPLLFAVGRAAHRPWRPLATACLQAVAAFTALAGAFLLWRRIYFGDWLPNTYYAKGGPGVADVLGLVTLQPASIARWLEAAAGAGGPLGGWLLAGLAAAIGLGLARRSLSRVLVVATLYLVVAGSIYVLLPRDWMPEFRFATPFVALFPVVGGLVTMNLLDRLPPARRNNAGGLVAGVCLFAATLIFLPRSLEFCRAPTVPFGDVQRLYGDGFNRIADRLQVAQGSFLLPDVGGTLWASRLRVVDLGKLCDPTIARTLGRDQPAFYDYVFAQVKPTFIHVHGIWNLLARLRRDPRFTRDYVPLVEFQDDWIAEHTGISMLSGDYLRREVAAAHPVEVEAIRRELAAVRARDVR